MIMLHSGAIVQFFGTGKKWVLTRFYWHLFVLFAIHNLKNQQTYHCPFYTVFLLIKLDGAFLLVLINSCPHLKSIIMASLSKLP